MVPLTQEALLSVATNLLFFFTIGSFGAFTKDFYETLTKKNERIRFGHILIGGTCATIVCYGLQDSWLSGFSINQMVLVTFICGVLGFEIFGNFTTIVKFKQFVVEMWEFKNRFTVQYRDPNNSAAPGATPVAPPPDTTTTDLPPPTPVVDPVSPPIHTATPNTLPETPKKEDTSK